MASSASRLGCLARPRGIAFALKLSRQIPGEEPLYVEEGGQVSMGPVAALLRSFN